MKKILCNTLWLLMAFAANAQWNGNPATGTNLSKSPGVASSKTSVLAVTDGAGGMFVAWIDNRAAATPTIYLQRVDQNGVLQFDNDAVVSAAAGAKSNLTMIPDGSGGVILSWQDSRNVGASTNTDIYGQRMNAAGAPVWASDGVRLTDADNTVSNKTISALEILLNSPSTTEGVVVFQDNRNAATAGVDLYAQKFLLSDGSVVWTDDVAVHGTTVVGTQNQQSVASDGAGGFYVAWQDQRTGSANTADLYAQHINNAGTPVAGWAVTGNAVSSQANIQNQPQLLSVGTTGFVVTWTDQRVGLGNGDIYIQQYNAAGAEQWTAGGVALTDGLTGNQSNPQITESGVNYIVTWSDARVATNDRNVYAQGVSSTGSVLWTANGVPVATVTAHQPQSVSGSSVGLSIVPDGAGGAIIVWDDARNNATTGTDIYAQRINSGGAPVWATDGVVVSNASGAQVMPVAVASVSGTALVVWRDSRTATNGDVIGARLQPNGVLPVRSIQLIAAAKSSGVGLNWSTVGELNTKHFVVEKSGDGRQFAAIGSVKAKGLGDGRYSFDDVSPAKGANFYRIRSVDADGKAGYSLVVMLQFNAAARASLALYPNPVQQTATLQLANLPAGRYQMRLLDLSGRTVLSKAITINNEYLIVPIDLQSLPAGSYTLQLQEAKGFSISKTLLKN